MTEPGIDSVQVDHLFMMDQHVTIRHPSSAKYCVIAQTNRVDRTPT